MKVLITEGAFDMQSYAIFNNLDCDAYIMNSRSQFKVDDFNLFVFSGGADINPEFYNEKNRTCHGIDKVKDKFEIELVYSALSTGGKLLGICRGHQLINVALGGSLYQDLKEITDNKHFTSHLLSPFDKGIVPAFFNTVNSMHHQAVKNVGLLLAVTSTFNNCIESTENKQIITTQFHPETMPSVFTDDFFKYIYAWSKTKKINLYKDFI